MKAFFHDEQLRHRPLTYFSRGKMRIPQEVPERVLELRSASALSGLIVSEPADAGSEPLLAVHTSDYLRFLQEAHTDWKALPDDWGEEVVSNIFVRTPHALRGVLARAAYYLADGSCPVGAHTWEAAYWSAQCAIAASREVLAGERFAYAGCRPPGHHARKDAAGGFCYLNNAAIVAQELRQRYQRVVVLDTDMHHGQGIQEIFYDRDDVYYISIHGDPENFYPVVAGFEDERGAGKGEGYNLNLCIPHHSSERVFFEKLETAMHAIESFGADALVLSLGFDIYEHDPQSLVAVSTEGFERLGSSIRALNLPTVVVQEGGYHVETLAENAVSFFNGLLAQRT
ncbi:histone deacetylase family protein [Paenalcaligenes niemegkensis]|uniref:histone deacetylase family protein n=1 Tax=Paenalcaligenes niemegkensis TaxID=2895469 RepID=UPI001EE80CCB|nr:histone deacetylase family protein [Paenalcaligenes niemegkensis]MCQ9617095.1 histone deacetylase family protein [Paenalcaligenes niemegkensis]